MIRGTDRAITIPLMHEEGKGIPSPAVAVISLYPRGYVGGIGVRSP